MIKCRTCITLIILVISLSYLQTFICYKKPEVKYITKTEVKDSIIVINDDSVLYYLKKFKVKYPKIVLSQAKLESNNYTSSLFKKNNNLFGMTIPTNRPTISIRLQNCKVANSAKYAKYTSYIESIIDYAMWQSYILHHIKSEQDYINYLAKYYATDHKYKQKLTNIIHGR